jgi:hypothetical protein
VFENAAEIERLRAQRASRRTVAKELGIGAGERETEAKLASSNPRERD